MTWGQSRVWTIQNCSTRSGRGAKKLRKTNGQPDRESSAPPRKRSREVLPMPGPDALGSIKLPGVGRPPPGGKPGETNERSLPVRPSSGIGIGGPSLLGTSRRCRCSPRMWLRARPEEAVQVLVTCRGELEDRPEGTADAEKGLCPDDLPAPTTSQAATLMASQGPTRTNCRPGYSRIILPFLGLITRSSPRRSCLTIFVATDRISFLIAALQITPRWFAPRLIFTQSIKSAFL